MKESCSLVGECKRTKVNSKVSSDKSRSGATVKQVSVMQSCRAHNLMRRRLTASIKVSKKLIESTQSETKGTLVILHSYLIESTLCTS
jgi:hypothetical protein